MGDSAELPSKPLSCHMKSVQFLTADPDDNNDNDNDDDNDSDSNDRGWVERSKIVTPETDGLISRPVGKVGCHKCGFSLPDVLGWTTDDFEAVKELVKSYVEDYLNHLLSMSNQPCGHVISLMKLVSGVLLNIINAVLTRRRF